MSRRAEPMRTCVGCRAVRPKAALVRVVRGADGRARIDRTAAGRGAYVCADTGCAARAVRPGVLGRAFRASCVVDTGFTERLVGAGSARGR